MTSRSDSYQHLYAEKSVDITSMYSLSYSPEEPEEIKEIKDKIVERMRVLVDEKLTDNQKQIFNLTSQGYTQAEIAKKLNRCQASITKAINGNVAVGFKNKHGGIVKKLKFAFLNDPEIKELRKEYFELISEWEEIIGIK
jgi:hypothetical protein